MTSNTMVVDVSQDWSLACDVQRRFMQPPAPTLETVSYAARCRQARALGGDCYDFIHLPQQHLAIAVGDASGKSLAAALMICNVQSSLRTAASFTGGDAAAVLEAVNRQVFESSLSDRFATLFYAVFDERTRRLQYANAGHHPPLILRDGRPIRRLEAGGLPLGILPDSTYPSGIVQLHPGDLMVAYTDGVTEAVNATGEQWGIDGLRRAVRESSDRSADEIADAIFTAMDEFSHGLQQDDATVVVLRVH